MRGSTGVATIGAVLAVVSGVEILCHGPLDDLDRRVALHYLPITWSTATHVARFLQVVGQPWLACLVIGAIALIVSMRRRESGPLLAAIIGLGGVGVITWTLKHVFPHPAIASQLPGSFPSGHTGVAVVAAGLLIWLVLRGHPSRVGVALLIAGLWGAVMAWGRLVAEAHWLSDVIAGWGLGMVALVAAIRTADSPLGSRGWARSAPDDR
ncbi:MAG: phosphatase PAP2 family protein [Marmoricola sp.]